jgi:hypothetical protein
VVVSVIRIFSDDTNSFVNVLVDGALRPAQHGLLRLVESILTNSAVVAATGAGCFATNVEKMVLILQNASATTATLTLKFSY